MPNVNVASGASRAPLLSDSRHRRNRAVHRAAQSVRWHDHRPRRLQRHRNGQHVVRRAPGRSVPRSAGHAVRRECAGGSRQRDHERSDQGAGGGRHRRRRRLQHAQRSAATCPARCPIRCEGRLAVQQYDSDGYVRNHFLNRDDTNNYDELTMRGKLHWQAERRNVVRLRRRLHRHRQRLRRVLAEQLAQHDLGPAGQGHAEVAASAA